MYRNAKPSEKEEVKLCTLIRSEKGFWTDSLIALPHNTTDCLHQSNNVLSIFDTCGVSNDVENVKLEFVDSLDLKVSCHNKIIVQTRAKVILGLPEKKVIDR